ncbi:MAG: hypothetical protein ACLVLH_13280 [Eisenbergiella massiliensis]
MEMYWIAGDRIGLRPMGVHRERMNTASSLPEVNGVRIFAMGADYIGG